MQILKVDGMTCVHCERAVTAALQSIDPVEMVEVDPVQGRVRMESRAGGRNPGHCRRGLRREARRRLNFKTSHLSPGTEWSFSNMRSVTAMPLVVLLFPVLARADSLFPVQNPYECIAEAKRSIKPDTERRTILAQCMARTDDAYKAAQALTSASFYVSASDNRQIERAMNSGNSARAHELLSRVILAGK